MSELLPPPHPRSRRRQRLAVLRQREEQISVLIAQHRLEIAALAEEDLGGLSARYVPDELAMLWRRSPRQARTRVDGARVFASFPAVHALIADGTWLIDHADAVVDELAGSDLEHEQQEQVLALVLSRRVHATPWELKAAVRTAIVVLFPEHAEDKAKKAQQDRDVRFYLNEPGGASLVACGPTPAIAAMLASLDALTFPAAADDARSAQQRRFDTLYDLVCGRAVPTQWEAQLVAAVSTVRGEDELSGEIPGLGPIPASQVREIVAGATLRRVVVDADTGQLVAVDDRVHRPDLGTAPAAPRGYVPGQADDDTDQLEADPEAPSAEDLSWVEARTDRDRIYAHLQWREEPGPDELEPPVGAHDEADGDPDEPATRVAPVHLSWQWSAEALSPALTRMSTEPVRPVDLHTDSYAVPPRLKRHLVLRDRTCVFPGCPRSALRCDKDHLIPWPRGSTSESNLADECEHHHQGKHDCLTVERLPDGTFHWTTPSGLTSDRPPRPVLDAWTYRPTLPPAA